MVDSEIKHLRLAKFSKYPGGRFRTHGPFSGEEFRETVLKPALDQSHCLSVDFVGAITVIPSFVDEAFGPLIEEWGADEFRKRITWVTSQETDVEQFIVDTIERRS